VSTETIERVNVTPRLNDEPPVDMPPMNVIKCQCSQSCPASGPCELEAEGDDLLCGPCRKAIKSIEMYRAGVFGSATAFVAVTGLRRVALHCHRCDPEFDQNGDDDAASGS
jgi:hypothetical protein